MQTAGLLISQMGLSAPGPELIGNRLSLPQVARVVPTRFFALRHRNQETPSEKSFHREDSNLFQTPLG